AASPSRNMIARVIVCPLLNKRIAILGSTGSIGCNALEVVAHLGSPYRAAALSAGKQVEKLAEQARKFRPAALGICDDSQAAPLRDVAKEIGAKAYFGGSGLA